VRYGDSKAVTANEIHIPAGVPVQVVGTTADVIHSFWIPELNRKIDLIPDGRIVSCSMRTRPERTRGHRLRGTAANGDVVPDLTHLRTRAMLEAGTIPNAACASSCRKAKR
jgi:hypothetical protein